jgi:hypothetical protein
LEDSGIVTCDVRVESQIAIGRREREERTAGMIDAEESGVLDDVHAFLVAVVWVRAPVDIGQKASGMAKPAFF